jgi:chromosome partitioning protein
MFGTTEPCSVCGTRFEMQFRYQMEDQPGRLSFYCSQACLRAHQTAGSDGAVSCDACGTRFRVELVTNVVYVGGLRRYACSPGCRANLAQAGRGLGLGLMAAASSEEVPSAVKSGDLPREDERSAAPPSELERAAAPYPRVIAVFNHKGGTGKTTTSLHLATGLALRKKRVLIVDTDAQGNVAVSLNLKAQRSLYHVVVSGLPFGDAVLHAREGLDVLPSNESLAAAELFLAGRHNRDRVLARRLEAARSGYDVIVVDCSPSLSLMNQNALVFADAVLVPVVCDYLSLVGVRQVIRTIRNVNQLLHHPVRLWGVLPTFYDGRARICRDAHGTLKKHFGGRCLGPIRATMKVKEAPAHGQTVFEYAPLSYAAEDYSSLVDTFLRGREMYQYPAAASA